MAVVAKLCEPSTHDVFARPRVSQLLEAASRCRLIWVSGPAGAGKTTAVCSWLTARRRPRTWYRVDAGDADAANLFHYLAMSAREPLPTMTIEATIAGFARRYFEALSAPWRDRHVLVLDDYHEARGQLDDTLRVAIAAVRPPITIVVISREPPSAMLSRTFASRDAVIVGWDALRLTSAEARGAARMIAKKRAPSMGVVDGLQRLTDGWAAGLAMLLAHPELAELAKRGHDEIARIGDSGRAQRVFDYIASEIFDHEPDATRRFLLQTAVLPAFTEAWAVELTGADNARAILHRLEAGPFAKRHVGGVYRYHPLFRAFLLDRAARLDGIADVRHRAAAVLVAAGELEAGFELLVETRDWPRCASLIARLAPELVAQGRRATLLAWIGALPDDVVQASGWLMLWRATCVLGREPLTSAALLDRAMAQFDARDVDGKRAAWSARVSACVHAGMDLSPIDRWLGELDADAPATIGHLLALFRVPGHPKATAWTTEALDRWRAIDDPSMRAMTAALLIPICCFSGELGRAATVLEGLRGERVQVEPLAAVTLANGEAVFAWTTANHAACHEAVERGLATAAASGIAMWNDQLAALGAAAALASCELDAAQPYLDRMREAAANGSNFATGNYEYYAGWQALLRGDVLRARAAIDVAVRLADAYGYPLAQILSRLALAHVLAVLGHDATRVLADASARADASRSEFLAFSCAMAEACITRSDDAIRRAFALGRALGIYNVFFSIRDQLGPCCERARMLGVEPAYVAELVKRHRLAPPVRIHAFGGLSIEGVLLGKKPPVVPLRLLAVLVALGGRDVSEAQLVDAVWPDADGARARASLHTTLHRLRKLLGHEDALRHHNGRVALAPDVVWLDAWDAERACVAVEAAVARGRRGELGAHVDTLLATYRGPLLGSDDTSACIVAARAKLHARIARSVRAAGRDLADL